MLKKYLENKWGKILIFSVVGAIVFTYLSTFFYQKEMAVTTAGEFTKEEALRMHMDTQVYKGWPSVMYWWGFGLPKVSSPLELIGYIPAYLLYFVIVSFTVVPNLLFWGLVSFVLVLLYFLLIYKKWIQ